MAICYGIGKQTPSKIYANTPNANPEPGDSKDKLYPDGMPLLYNIPKDTEEDGDGTITAANAQIEGIPSCKVKGTDHAFLPRGCKDFVVKFIETGDACKSCPEPSKAIATKVEVSTPDVLSIYISSGMNPLLTNPSDHKYSFASINQDGATLSVNNPQEGLYKIDVNGITEKVFFIRINYVDSKGNPTTEPITPYSHKDKFPIKFTINKAAKNVLTIE